MRVAAFCVWAGINSLATGNTELGKRTPNLTIATASGRVEILVLSEAPFQHVIVSCVFCLGGSVCVSNLSSVVDVVRAS